MKSVNVNEVIKYINENFIVGDVDVSKSDFNDGSGVYGISIGSRGEIDDIFKVDDFKLRSKEEIIEDNMFEGDEDEREYYEEFCNSGEIDWNDFGGLYEGLNEECSIEYYNVVV